MFDKHFRMDEEDAIKYALEKLDVFSTQDELDCEEVGDGNVNYIFRVFSRNSDKSVIIKQADVATRLNKMPLSTDRNRIEAELLQIEEKYAGDMVPKVYLFDPNMSCLAMEDLSDHEIMRYAVMREEIFPGFAEKISTFMVETLANTTDLIMPADEKKELVRAYINPEMCDISERLVYTDPYTIPVEKGDVADCNVDYVNEVYQQDTELKLEVAKLKLDFMNNAQALIHGDLHTGSIFIKPNSVKVIDPEFAFFGPIGYDVGNVIANLMFAWARALVRDSEDQEKHQKFLDWIKTTTKDTVDLFKEKFEKLISEKAQDLLFSLPEFQSWYVDTVLADTAAVTGLEINRRIIGIAKVKDITTLEDEKRCKAERILMESAKRFIVDRSKYNSGLDYLETFEELAEDIIGS